MQRVKISGSTSDWTYINRGVPQGSVLGPLLFNIFINDLFYVNMSGKIANYADDNNVYNSHSSFEFLCSNLTDDMSKTMSWYHDNDLEANPVKFQCTIMDRKGVIDTSIPVQNDSIKSSDTIKVLGVGLDSRLSFDHHIKSMCSRASNQINALKRISRFLNVDGRLQIYKAFIRANFSYCPVSWIFCGKRNSKKLEKLQERALRLVYNDYTNSYSELLSKANMFSLSMYRLRFLAIEVYKCVNNLNPHFMNEMFATRPVTYNLRDNNLLHQPTFKTFSFGYKSFKYYGAKLWNSLPSDLKQCDSLYRFKSSLNKWCSTEAARNMEIC